MRKEAAEKAFKMAELRRKGYTLEEIGRRYGCTRQWVHKLVSRVDKTPYEKRRGPKSVYTEKQWEWVRQRAREGYKIDELVQFVGLTENTVRIHLREGYRALPPLESRKAEFNALRE